MYIIGYPMDVRKYAVKLCAKLLCLKTENYWFRRIKPQTFCTKVQKFQSSI